MAYWVSSVVRGSTVCYPSDSLASYFFIFAIMPLTGVKQVGWLWHW